MNNKLFRGFFRVGDKKIHSGEIAQISKVHEWHNLRLSEKSAPNANPDAPRPSVLIGGKLGIRETVERVMARYGVKPATKRTVVAGEFIVTANSEYFGGYGFESWDAKVVRKWLKATMKMLRKTFGDRLVAVVLHMDEAAPHLHAYVVPLAKHRKDRPWSPNCRKQRIKAGQWKVAGRDFFFRTNLISFQDAYGEAIKPIGLLRGQRGSRAKHREMKDAYRDFKAAEKLADGARKELESQKLELQLATEKAEQAKQKTLLELKNSEKTRADLAEEITKTKGLQARLERERKELANLREKLRGIPIREVLKKMEFEEDEQGTFSAFVSDGSRHNTGFRYQVFATGEQFRTEVFKRDGLDPMNWVKAGSGKGAIDLLTSLSSNFSSKQTIAQVCGRLAEWFPERTGSLILELAENSQSKDFRWNEIVPMLRGSPDKPVTDGKEFRQATPNEGEKGSGKNKEPEIEV